jgi:hypothetical protein
MTTKINSIRGKGKGSSVKTVPSFVHGGPKGYTGDGENQIERPSDQVKPLKSYKK